jgi:glycosyltransferase involved in cell wall biosynthesis
MKKLLIISYYWPPAGGPGSQRVLKFSKFLPDFGWSPYILTVRNGEYPYIDNSLEREINPKWKVYSSKTIEPFNLYKKLARSDPASSLPVGQLTQKPENIKQKLFNWLRTNIFLPDARMGWILPGYLRARKIIQSQGIQAVVSSSPPHSLQLIAYLIKKEFQLPWIADFRDPWTDIQYYQVSKRNKFSRHIDLWLERQVLRGANHLTSVSSSIGQSFQEKLNQPSKDHKVSIIPNGWDPEDFKTDSEPDSSKFIILHSGNMNATQNPSTLLKALQNLKQTYPTFKKDLNLKFIGRIHPTIQKEVSRLNLDGNTEYSSFLPHQQILGEIQKAAVLLSVVPDVPDNKGIVMSKNFEYIGSGRPILIIGPMDSDIAKIISKFNHSRIINYKDTKTCEIFLEKRYQGWKNREYPFSNRKLRDIYSRANLTGVLVEILNEITQI